MRSCPICLHKKPGRARHGGETSRGRSHPDYRGVPVQAAVLDLEQRTSHAASSDERRLSQVKPSLAGNAFGGLTSRGRDTRRRRGRDLRARFKRLLRGCHFWFLQSHVTGARIASTDANGNRAAGFVRPWALQPRRPGVSPAKTRGPVSDRAKRRDQAAKRRLGPSGLATLMQARKQASQPGCLFPGIAPS